ncbi:hypothetical protein PWT90_06598 [Aphanocladium album]|nr:hypothetical protein PWT90_06598 [Aphanocladium album]
MNGCPQPDLRSPAPPAQLAREEMSTHVYNTGIEMPQRKRQRAFALRAKTGCKTCRERRIKCDEGKPICHQCLSSRRSCHGLGYDGQLSTTLAKSTSVMLQPDLRVYPVGIAACRNDIQLFHIFRTRIANQITGGLDLGFWIQDLLQAAYIHPALWHAILAMTATQSETDNVSALKHHHLSIRHMLDTTTQSNELSYLQKEMVLMAAILLTTVCSLQGHLREALIHAKNGLRLYYQWNFWQYLSTHREAPSQLGVIRPNCLILFMEFLDHSILAFTFETERPLSIINSARGPASGDDFESLTEAYFELLLLMNQSIHAWSDIRADYLACRQGPVPDHRLPYRRAVSHWRRRFMNLKQRLTETGQPADENILWRLELYCVTMEMSLYADLSEPACTIIPSDSTMEHMQELVEKIFASETERVKRDEHAAKRSPFFSFSLSIAPQLGVAATFCRKRSIRQRATFLLKSWPRMENLWSGALIAAVAENLHRVEDEGLLPNNSCKPPCVDGEFVCFHHRVMSSYIAVNTDGKVEHRIRTVGDIQHGRPERRFMLKYLD